MRAAPAHARSLTVVARSCVGVQLVLLQVCHVLREEVVGPRGLPLGVHCLSWLASAFSFELCACGACACFAGCSALNNAQLSGEIPDALSAVRSVASSPICARL